MNGVNKPQNDKLFRGIILVCIAFVIFEINEISTVNCSVISRNVLSSRLKSVIALSFVLLLSLISLFSVNLCVCFGESVAGERIDSRKHPKIKHILFKYWEYSVLYSSQNRCNFANGWQSKIAYAYGPSYSLDMYPFSYKFHNNPLFVNL